MEQTTKCECGTELNYAISPFMTSEKRVCPNCNRVHYVDTYPIDWDKIRQARDSEAKEK